MRLIRRNNIRHFFWCQTCTKVHAQTQQKEKETFLFFYFSLFYFPFLFSVFLFCFLFPIILEIINYTLSNNPSITRLYNKIYTYIYIQLLVLIIPIIEITILFRSLLPLPSQYRRKFLFKRKQLLYKVFSFSFFHLNSRIITTITES